MILLPKRVKYNKIQKSRVRGVSSKATKLDFGTYGLRVLEAGRISNRQIEASRKAIMGKIKRIGKLWIRVFPDIPITKKAVGIRMGRGKGSLHMWIARVRKNRIIFELNCNSKEIADRALNYAKTKLPLKTKIIYIK